MKPTLKVKFVDFWEDLNKMERNYFAQILSEKYTIEFSDTPDILFYSCYSREYLKYNCTRVFFSPENWRPNFTECDYAITFDYIDDKRHLRLPLWAYYYMGYIHWFKMEKLDTPKTDEALLANWKSREKFCAFIVSNGAAQKRVDFFHKLNAQKKVDSAGRHLNNIGGNLEGGTVEKLAYIKDFKFVISFENESHNGYLTEKLLEPLLAGCIPIYWGDPLVARDFNTKRFLNYEDFNDDYKLIERIVEIEGNDELALQYLKQPCFNQEHKPIEKYTEELNAFLFSVSNNLHTSKPVAKNIVFTFYNSTKRILKRIISRFTK